ncbi:hypothetical protein SAMN05428997_1386 [Bosea sp. CRIB-10]|uniref:sulfotransferase family protein n=1 Tax=Bosea sp. CRIB-10 TaxID=378404 RepID=UPI0008F27617|nr:hypothetical protein [Bosea sp. CRIB-10]SFD64204.1 hypothetical protein SAMN05428997_1386 [Bosea sp. CRIB-10]
MTGKTAVLITGMHRSGTSALARCVSLLGAKLPDMLVPANAGNPEGHWEPKAVVDLNDRMLADAGSEVYSMIDFGRAWFDSARAQLFREEAAKLVESAYDGDPFIIIKDPRTALLLPIWEDALRRLDYRVVHILPLRSPAEVADSLRRRHLKDFPYDGWAAPRGEFVWMRYTLSAVQGTRPSPRAFVRYEDLLADWRREMRRVAQETNITWPRLGSIEAERAIDGFLHGPEAGPVHRDAIGDGEALSSVTPSQLAERFYRTLSERGDDQQATDAIASEFATRTTRMGELLAAFEAMYPVVWRYYEESTRAAAQIESARRTEAGMHQAIQALWTKLNEHVDDKGALRQLLDSTSERARSFEQHAISFDFEREELKKLIAELRNLYDHEVAVRRDAEEGREALRDHAAALHRQLEQAEQDREALRNHAAEVHRQLDERSVECENAHQALRGIHRSLAWRLSAPLRAVARLTRAVSGRAR